MKPKNVPAHTISETNPPDKVSEDNIRTYVRLAKGGGLEARNNLIKANFGLIVTTAKKFHHHGSFEELGDLIQQGCIGLLHAIGKFDPTVTRRGKNVKFATYAVYWIRHFIRREIDSRGRTVAVPVNIQYYLKKASQASHADNRNHKQAKERDRLAKVLGISKRHISSLPFAALNGISVDQENHESILSFDNYTNMRMNIRALHTAQHTDLHALLTVLSDRERFLIEHRHGLIPGEGPKVLEEVGQLMGISRERVRQIERRAIMRMRAVGTKEQLLSMSATGLD